MAVVLTAAMAAPVAAAPPAQGPPGPGTGIEELGAKLAVAARRPAREGFGSRRPPERTRECAVAAPPGPVLALVEREIAPWLQAHQRPGAPARALRVIGVAVHVITHGAAGDVETASIDRQLAVLDAAFESAGISFRRVGLSRTSNADWFAMTPGSLAEREAKTALAWDSRFYLNLYTGDLGRGASGWATFPWDRLAHPALDGVVIRHSSLPGLGERTSRGEAAVHEVAHWLGLHSANDSCLHGFTAAQISRISAMLATYRREI